jgi:hypothetical protein
MTREHSESEQALRERLRETSPAVLMVLAHDGFADCVTRAMARAELESRDRLRAAAEKAKGKANG